MRGAQLCEGLLLRLRVVSQPGRHVVYKVTEILFGSVFLSPPVQALWRAGLQRRPVTQAAGIRTAMIAHVYYPDLLDEVLACWQALPQGSPLHVTAPHDRAGELRARLGAIAGVTVHAFDNRGRDIAPFLAVLGSGALDGYDAVLKLHTKKSPHLWTGDLRRRLLFALLADNAAQVHRILSVFAHPRVGMAGWRWMLRTRPSYWNANKATVRKLMERATSLPPLKGGGGSSDGCCHTYLNSDGPPPSPLRGRDGVGGGRTTDASGPTQDDLDLAFFEGSMFWFRPAALVPLRRLALIAADFEPEAGQTDGALHHAVERCFCLAARAAGYRTTDLKGRLIL